MLRATDTSFDNLSLKSVASFESEGSDTVVLRLKGRNASRPRGSRGIPVVMPGKADIGTGAYQIVKRKGPTQPSRLSLATIGASPRSPAWTVVNYPTRRNAWSALMRGEIDMLLRSEPRLDGIVQAETTVRTFSFPRATTFPGLQRAAPGPRSVEVRRAINDAPRSHGPRPRRPPRHGLDRPTAQCGRSTGRISQPGTAVHVSIRPPPARASTRPGLSARAGRRTPCPDPLQLHVPGVSRTTRGSIVVAVIAQKELADIGIDMQLDRAGRSASWRGSPRGDFDAFLFEMSGRSLQPRVRFLAVPRGDDEQLGYRAADGVLDRIRDAQTEDETRAGGRRAAACVMHDDPPAAFIAWQRTSERCRAVRRRVRGRSRQSCPIPGCGGRRPRRYRRRGEADHHRASSCSSPPRRSCRWWSTAQSRSSSLRKRHATSSVLDGNAQGRQAGRRAGREAIHAAQQRVLQSVGTRARRDRPHAVRSRSAR